MQPKLRDLVLTRKEHAGLLLPGAGVPMMLGGDPLQTPGGTKAFSSPSSHSTVIVPSFSTFSISQTVPSHQG
jgi:hypothetical protein